MTPDPVLVAQIAVANNLPVHLLTAQIMQESDGDPMAFRYEHAFFERYIHDKPDAKGFAYGPLAACSYGLLQIMLETALEIGYTDRPELLFLPRVGLTWGAKRMAILWNLVGSIPSTYRVALAAYNGGASLLHVAEATWPQPVQSYVSTITTRAETVI